MDNLPALVKYKDGVGAQGGQEYLKPHAVVSIMLSMLSMLSTKSAMRAQGFIIPSEAIYSRIDQERLNSETAFSCVLVPLQPLKKLRGSR